MINTVYFEKGSNFANVYNLYQWDYGQSLEIKGLDVHNNVWVQFSMNASGGNAIPVVTEINDGVITANIPAFVFEKETSQNYNAYAFVYVSNADSGETVKVIKLNIKARPKPEDYVYTEPEKKRYELLEERVKELEENGVPGGPSQDNTSPIDPKRIPDMYYKENTMVEILPETKPQVSDGEDSEFLIPVYVELEVGKEYTVIYNGKTYVSKGQLFSMNEDLTAIILGNGTHLGLEGNDEPFAIANMDGILSGIDFSGTKDITIAIYDRTEKINTIKDEYFGFDWLPKEKKNKVEIFKKQVINVTDDVSIGDYYGFNLGLDEETRNKIVNEYDSLSLILDGFNVKLSHVKRLEEDGVINSAIYTMIPYDELRIAHEGTVIIGTGKNVTAQILLTIGEHELEVSHIEKNIEKIPKKFIPDYVLTDEKVDSELSKESLNPVQNKVVAEAVEKLSEEIGDQKKEMVKSVNGFVPDENGDVTIQYDTTTEKGYRHSGLSKYPKTITLYRNDKYTNEPYVFFGKNYWPASENVDGNYDRYGLSLITDKHNVTITGTATAGSSYILVNDDGGNYHALPDGMTEGDVFRLYVFGNVSENISPYAKIEFFDESKTRLSFVQTALVANKNFASNNVTIPNGARYMRFMFSFSSGSTYDNTIFPVFVKANAEVITSQGFAKITSENETLELCTAPFESVVDYQLDLKEYIDSKTNEVDFDMEEIEGVISFVSPEMFGAYGDGLHDDTMALQTCINFAIENNKKVVCGGKYKTKASITINANNFTMDANKIEYDGTDCAFIASGSYNNLRFSQITSVNGFGFRLISDVDCCQNNIYIGWVYSYRNCVEYIGTNRNIIGNTLTFGKLECKSNANCIYQTEETILPEGYYHNNNNFIGGFLCGGEWGVYGAKGHDTYITPQFENVGNCIWHNGVGVCRVIAPRYVEVCITGLFIKMVSPFDRYPYEMSKTFAFDVSPHAGQLRPLNIDLSLAPIEFEDVSGNIIPFGKTYPSAWCVHIPLDGKDGRRYCNEFYVFGRHILIKNPTINQNLNVTATNRGYVGDYRVTGDEDTEFNIYNHFTITENGCDYTLPPSYDLIAFNRFIVEQTEGTSCVFRDWRGTIIFNGADYGSGVYEVVAQIKDGELYDFYDNRNQSWTIRRMSDYSLVDTMPHEA